MATYSLLQVSLEQTISRESLEEASVVIPSVARADCAHLQRDLFGIVVSGLLLEEAKTFQAELKRRGFPTDLAADRELPVLHEPFTIQRIELDHTDLRFTDAMGRTQLRLLDDLVFVAGGFMTSSKVKSMLVADNSSPARMHSFQDPVHLERVHRINEVPEFRLDFFFCTEPHRLRASVSAENTVFFQGRPLRLKDRALLLGAMMDLQELLPRERVGAGLRQLGTEVFYPSLRSYEEEIRWHFYRLTPRA